MPPSYKPLAAGIQGIPDEIFNTPSVSWEDAQKTQALLRAQELNNQANEISLAEKQRIINSQKQLRDAISSQYGGMDPDSFDPDQALRTAEKLSFQTGDLDQALAIERARREHRAGVTPLSEVQRQFLMPSLNGQEIPEGITVQDLNLRAALERGNTYAQQVGIQANDPNRELNAETKRQRLLGEQIRPMTPSQVETLTEMNGLSGFVDNIKDRYLPYISENRGERFLDATVNPNSAAARMKGELDLIATQLAAAYNGKRLSDLDFKTMSKLVQVNDLDTMETVNDKLDRLKELMNLRKGNMLGALEQGRFNISGFKTPDSETIGTSGAPENLPPLANYSQGRIPRNPDGSVLTREQFMKLRNGGQ